MCTILGPLQSTGDLEPDCPRQTVFCNRSIVTVDPDPRCDDKIRQRILKSFHWGRRNLSWGVTYWKYSGIKCRYRIDPGLFPQLINTDIKTINSR